ncbi:MAG: LysM peptidoglycan-binding domain-containing protein [Caldilineaceae bacterium]|nr:LysM peptidoglycan-binding domain-containing protein [Caldilineaceae bacterium]
MAIERTSLNSVERRCPNCGTRVARDAESCFMCGHDLRVTPRRAQRVSLVDALLVLAVVAVLVLWWQVGNRPQPATDTANAAIAPGNVPLLTGTVPATETPLPTVTPTPLPPTTTYVRHQVLTGETLLSIAAQYDVTVEEIQAVNNLQNALIRAGDILIIPVLQEGGAAIALTEGPTSRFQYTVRPGDTIISIAVNFGSTVDEILQINNLTEQDIIRPGDQLLIPLRQTPTEVLESAATAVAEPPSAATVGTATDGSGTIYLEPRLIGPADGSHIARTDELLFRWISVDVLQANEWYVLLIYPEGGATQPFPSVWTKATSYRIGPEFAPAAGQSATYSWQVSLARVKTSADGQLIIEAASPASAVRRFSWE